MKNIPPVLRIGISVYIYMYHTSCHIGLYIPHGCGPAACYIHAYVVS